MAILMMLSDFENAQEARRVLTTYGWVPLTKLGSKEFWIRRGHVCTLTFDGDNPSEAELKGYDGIDFIRLKSGEILVMPFGGCRAH